MLADYVMKGIDSLFSEKLSNNQLHSISKHSSKQIQHRAAFNRDTIKKSLHTIIKKANGCSRSPNATADRQPSPISKSRLKVILQHNKDERLKSVVKKVENGRRQTSPYQKIEVDGTVRPKEEQADGGEVVNKENNIIKYYRQVRKSMDKANLEKSGLKDGKKSRIFGKNSILSRNISKGDFRADRF